MTPLSPEQRRAVERTGQDVCVVAGPGSGKTRVLTERFAWLVEHQRLDPTRILAITFTEKAAVEIKQRLITRFAARADLREPIERAWVSTIHGFCARLLKEHAIEAGLSPDFTVLEQAPAARLQREAAEEALDELFAERPAEMRRLLEAVDLSTQDDSRQPDLAAALLGVYEAMRVAGVSTIPAAAAPPSVAEEVRRIAADLARGSVAGAHGHIAGDWAARFLGLPPGPLTRAHLELATCKAYINRVQHPGYSTLKNELLPQLEAEWLAVWYAGLDALLREALARIGAAHRARKRREAAVDFSDLESITVDLLERHPGIRRETRARFDQVLMDELQDTNRMQWRLVDLVRTRLFAVGDINQSIYSFRYADPDVFSEYRAQLRDDGAGIDELRGNYRSRPEILEAVARTLDGQEGIEPRELEALADFPPAPATPVELLIGRGGDAASVEAALVAARIREFHDRGAFAYRDIAVLFRTFAGMEPFEEAFDRFGIPFLVSGGRGFLEARETRDVTGFLAALVNPLDEIALIGVLRGPLVNLSDEEILALAQQGGHEAWQRVFEERFGELRRLAGFLPPDLLIARALDACGYTRRLPERARANVEKLLALLRHEFRTRPRPLAELLDDLEALRRSESIPDAPPPETGDVVRMMTIHAAKGLEFPVVFLSALHKEAERRSPALLFSPTGGLGVKWRHPVTGQGVSGPIHESLKQAKKHRDQAEEDRLLYVAMTRAMDRLILSYAERSRGASKWQKLAAAAIPEKTVADEAPQPPEPAPIPTRPQAEPLASGVWRLAPAQHDASASVTSVALFAACPRRYYLSRYLGLDPEPDRHGTGALALGEAVHRVLAGEPPASDEAAQLAAVFETSGLGRRAAQAPRAEREFDFLFELEDVILRGQIDLWFEDAEGLILVDYKTDRDQSSAPAYVLQLQLYALALERYTGRPPTQAVLYYLRPDARIEVPLMPAALEGAKSAVRALREAQQSLEFPLRVGDWCGKCPFWGGVCPAGRKEGDANLGLVSWPPSSSPEPAKDVS